MGRRLIRRDGDPPSLHRPDRAGVPHGIALDFCRGAGRIKDSTPSHQNCLCRNRADRRQGHRRRGKPLDGAVISALAAPRRSRSRTRPANYTLKQLPPGPYLVRVHLTGFLAGRSAMVNVRPSTAALRRSRCAAKEARRAAHCRGIGRRHWRRARTTKSGDRNESESAGACGT